MKPLSAFSLFSLLATSLYVAAEPINALPRGSSKFDNVSRNPPPFERRADSECSPVLDDLIETTTGSTPGTAVAMFVAGTGSVALGVCQLLANHGQASSGDCIPFTAVVAGSITAVFGAIQLHNSGTTTASRRSDISLATSLMDWFDANEMEYGQISTMSISKRGLRGWNSTTGDTKIIQDRASIHRLKYQGQYMDAIVTTYTDGTGRVFGTPAPANATSLTKRHDGPGFKTNFQLLYGGVLSVFDQFNFSTL